MYDTESFEMDNLIFALNATVPVFMMMVIGYVLKRLKFIDDVFAGRMNNFVFKISLPVLVFGDLAVVDFREGWNTKFVLFCFFVTILSILISYLVSFLVSRKTNASERGEFIQASYRSSAALLGLAFIQNIYGTTGMAPLMIIGSVPLYNIFAVIVLTVSSPDNRSLDSGMLKKTFTGVLKNPIIIGIALGLIWSLLKIPMPGIMLKTVTNIGNTAMPLGLMAMGASFELKKAFGKGLQAVVAGFMKLIGFASIFLPCAIAFGFRESELVAILVMLGSATTVSCFVMAKNMGHEGTLTSAVVMLTTLLSAFTLTMWLFILKSGGFI